MTFTTELQAGVCATPDAETQNYLLNHSMLRIKDPERSLDFYTRVMGMRLLRRLDFEEGRFSLYFLAMTKGETIPEDVGDRQRYAFGRQSVLELTHNWGSENDDSAYHNGNSDPRGFGHICFAVPDIRAACRRFEQLGVKFVKRLDEGKLKDVAFISDPDEYWIELVQPDLSGELGR